MKLCILLLIAIVSLACGLPAPITLEQMDMELQQEVQQQLKNKEQGSVASLKDDADVGAQHSNEGARKLRHLYGGPWIPSRTIYLQPDYYYYYYYNYHNCWW